MAGIPFELKGKTVFVAGHGGMVGGALVRRLARENVEFLTVARTELDLRDQAAVFSWFADTCSATSRRLGAGDHSSIAWP
jgi:GDP-L-fucose synthase